MVKITTWVLGVLLLLSSGALMAASSIQPTLAVLVDANGTETIDSVSAPDRQKEFRILPQAFSAGYTRNVYWLRFTLSRPSPDEAEAVLEIHPVFLQNLRLYEPLDSSGKPQYAMRQSGSLLPFTSREFPYRGFAYKIDFSDRQPRVFYVRLQTSTTSLMTIREWSLPEFRAKNMEEYVWLGLFFGVIITVFIVNFLNWIWTREALFKCYVIYVGMLTLYFFSIDGFGAQFIFPTQPYWADKWVSSGTLLTIASTAPFFSRILATDAVSAHRWKWLYRILLWFPIIVSPAPFFDMQPVAGKAALILLSLALVVGLFRSAFIFLARQTLSATFILLAHVVGLLSVLSAALTSLGVLPGDFWLIYGMQVGLMAEALLFSMAVSVRIREASKEKQDALERVIAADQRTESERAARHEQGRFMAMLTHELKTPMSVIRVALNGAGLAANSMRHAEQAIQDMNNVIDRCIQIDSLEQHRSELRIESIDVAKLIRELVLITGQHNRMVLHVSAFMHLDTDRQYLGIAISNLLDNAIKYAEPDTPIRIFLREEMRAQRPGISILFENMPGVAGMPAAEQVFKKYYRSTGAHAKTGSGLGLYLVQSMSDLIGAQVSYLPSAQLVRFELWLPR